MAPLCRAKVRAQVRPTSGCQESFRRPNGAPHAERLATLQSLRSPSESCATGTGTDGTHRHQNIALIESPALRHPRHATREAQHRLSGEVQVDDAYLGGEPPGGKPRSRHREQGSFVAAVSLNEAGNPALCQAHAGGRLHERGDPRLGLGASLTPVARVLSDGLAPSRARPTAY